MTVYVKFVVRFIVNKTLHHFYFRFLTAGDFLQLWQHEVKEGASENVSFQLGSAEDSDQETQTTWSCLWKTRPANSIAFLAYSSDGSLFATAGANDRLVRVWYQNQQCKLKVMDYGHPARVFFRKSQTFGMEQTNWAENFGSIWGIFGRFISTHFIILGPFSMFSIHQSFFLLNTQIPKIYLGFEFGPQRNRD